MACDTRLLPEPSASRSHACATVVIVGEISEDDNNRTAGDTLMEQASDVQYRLHIGPPSVVKTRNCIISNL